MEGIENRENGRAEVDRSDTYATSVESRKDERDVKKNKTSTEGRKEEEGNG